MKNNPNAGPRSHSNRLLPALCVAAVALLTAAPQVGAQTNIWTNPITGANPNTANPYTTGDIVASNITVSGIGRGPGIAGSNANDRYNANSWNTVGIDLTAYFTFTLTPSSGFEIDFNSFVYTGQASGTGATSFAFRSSVDSFAANIGTPTATGATISLSGASYQNITTAIEFRLYGWGASAATGTFSVNQFNFTGLVNSTGGGASDYYWAGDGVNIGGSGTWNTGNTNWSATNSPILGIAWDSTKKAIFTNPAGTVTVATVSANAGIQFATTGYSLTNGTLTLGGATIGLNAIVTDTGVTTTIGSTLAGTAGLSKSGAGTLVLSGANSFSGGIALNAGGLSVSAASNLGDAGNDIVFGGGTLVTTASFETGSGADFSGSGAIDIAGGTTLTNNGAFSMSGLTLNNTGTLVLNGATRSVGNLAFSAGGTVSGSGAISATGLTADSLTSGTATVNPAIVFSTGDKITTVGTGGNLVLNGDLSGTTGRILKYGAGTLEVNGNNSIGGFRLGAAGATNGGTLVAGSAASMGTNTFQFNYGTFVAKAPMTITNVLSIGGRDNGAAVIGGTNAIEFSGPVSWFTTNAGSAYLNVDNSSTFSGVVSNVATTGTKLVFGGAGTLTLSGSSANTFTNATVISNTLTVNLNKSASTTAIGGDVEVQTGATLLISATEQVVDTSAVTLSGGTISRASGVSETFGDLNLTAASTLDYVGGTSGTLAFGIYEGNATPDFKLTINSFFMGNKLTFANDLSAYIDAAFVGTSFSNDYFAINGMSSFGFESNWNGSTFTITAVPEPSTYAAAAGLVGLMLWPARRRILKDTQRIFGLRGSMRDRLARLRA